LSTISLGNSIQYDSPCSAVALAVGLAEVREAGVVPVVAAGNSGFATGLGSPGCAPAAVSVGAVYDAAGGPYGWRSCNDMVAWPDKPTCFSNSASYLSILAPGYNVTAGGYSLSGTSQATPHVAAALAMMMAAAPGASVNETVDALRQSGLPVRDPRTGFTTPRLNLAAALAQITRTALVDTTAPTGTLLINNAVAPTWTSSSSVALTVLGRDLTGIAGMCISNSDSLDCPAFSPLTTSIPVWNLSSGDGPKTVRVWLQDNAGNVMKAPASATIALDTLPPTGDVAINGGAAATRSLAVTLSLQAVDANGQSGMKMCLGTSAATCASTGSVIQAFASTVQNYQLPAGADGARTVWLRLKDQYGRGMPDQVSASIIYDTQPPTNAAVLINGGNSSTTASTSVRLSISADDAGSNVTRMCISNTASCTNWVPFAGSVNWTLAAGADGLRTVYVWCGDAAGNNMVNPVQASLTYDGSGPSGASVQINGGAAWASSSDVVLSIAASDYGDVEMCISDSNSSCTAFVPFAATAQWSLPPGEGQRSVFVTLRDWLGNSALSPVSASISVDGSPPTNGSLVINGGADWTNSPAVMLSVEADDSYSGLGSSCIANSNAVPCTEFVPLNSTRIGGSDRHAAAVVWSLAPSDDGAKTVFVTLRDRSGQQMAAVLSASIGLDQTAPSSVRLLINGGAAFTKQPNVTLSVTGYESDYSGVTEMCVTNSNATACAEWVPFAPVVAWALEGGEGRRAVFVTLRDRAGNSMPSPVSASIAINEGPPSHVQVTLNSGARFALSPIVSLVIAPSDARGITDMCISNQQFDGPDGCSPFQPYQASLEWTLAPEGEGLRTVWVTLRDSAGEAMPSPANASIIVDLTPPTDGLLEINSGAVATADPNVQLLLAARDAASNVTSVCIQESASVEPAVAAAACAPWVPYSRSKPLRLPGGPGLKAVRVFFADAAARVTPQATQANIWYDPTPPTMPSRRKAGLVASIITNTSVTLSWAPAAAASDGAGSGVAAFTVSWRQSSSAPLVNCKPEPSPRVGRAPIPAGRIMQQGLVSGVTITGLTPNKVHAFRLCAHDFASNTAKGVTLTARTRKK